MDNNVKLYMKGVGFYMKTIYTCIPGTYTYITVFIKTITFISILLIGSVKVTGSSAVVIDNGTYLTKAGFAGAHTPTSIFKSAPSEVGLHYKIIFIVKNAKLFNKEDKEVIYTLFATASQCKH